MRTWVETAQGIRESVAAGSDRNRLSDRSRAHHAEVDRDKTPLEVPAGLDSRRMVEVITIIVFGKEWYLN